LAGALAQFGRRSRHGRTRSSAAAAPGGAIASLNLGSKKLALEAGSKDAASRTPVPMLSRPAAEDGSIAEPPRSARLPISRTLTCTQNPQRPRGGDGANTVAAHSGANVQAPPRDRCKQPGPT
jgi:hypothetical protein